MAHTIKLLQKKRIHYAAIPTTLINLFISYVDLFPCTTVGGSSIRPPAQTYLAAPFLDRDSCRNIDSRWGFSLSPVLLVTDISKKLHI
jgi:hypothetical protein